MPESADHDNPFLRLSRLVPARTLDEARRLADAGAVLDTAWPSRRVALARVANERGRFEQVRLSFARGGLVPGCSCGPGRRLCVHAVAVLLQLASRGIDGCGDWDLVHALAGAEPKGRVPAAGGSAPLASRPQGVPQADSGGRTAAARSLRELAGPPERDVPAADHPVLRVILPAPPPLLDSRWAKLAVGIDLRCRERAYGLTNIRRLVETGSGAGGMAWSQFPAQAQQVLRFLLLTGSEEEHGFLLGSFDAADLLDLLCGLPGACVGSAPLHVHDESAQAVLVLLARGANGECHVRPGFRVRAEAGEPGAAAGGWRLLPAGDAAGGVVGRGHHWLFLGEHAWRVPAVLDPGWFRRFLRGAPEVLAEAEWRRLAAAAQAGRLPVAVVAPEEAGAVALLPAAPCEALLQLDWADREVRLRVAFDYGAARTGPGAGDLLATATGFLRRDSAAEERCLRHLRDHGFLPAAGGVPGDWVLANPDQLWDFWRHGFEELSARWRVLVSLPFLAARAQAGLARPSVQAGAEGTDWFELNLRFHTEQGGEIAWADLVRAVLAGQHTLLSGQDVLVRIPDSVRTLVQRLQEDASETGDGRVRFRRFSAPLVAETLGPLAAGLKADWLRLAEALAGPPRTELEGLPPDLLQTLRGYQREGVAWLDLLEQHAFHGILADEMGLGKTVQALALLARRKAAGRARGPSLVVCPSSLLDNWRNEAERFAPGLRTLVVRGLHRAALLARLPDVDLAITSYALLRRDVAAYQHAGLDYLILDEAQHIKNAQTANAQTCKRLPAAHRLILTGTPLENALHEVWSLFDFLLPGYLGGRQAFHRRYESAGADDGAAAHALLAARIRPFVLRRRKADVCHELPPKQEQRLYCEMDARQTRLYATFLAAGRELLRGGGGESQWRENRFQVLALLMRLRQVCCHPLLLPAPLREPFGSGLPSAKTDLLQEVVLEAIDSGRRVILFSQFTSFLRLFRPWLEEQGIAYEYLDGATPPAERQSRVDRFNRDPAVPLFLLSLRAGGTGLNLTGADTVIHYDQWWNPMVEDQATDRTHRIGQRKTVTALKLMVRGSVEEKIDQLQQRKRLLFDQVMAGVPARLGELSRADVLFLLGEGGR